jgi:hypothetical protein
MATDLISERVQEFDGVNRENRVDGPLGSLQVGEDVLAEELHDIDKNIGRRHTELDWSACSVCWI